MKWLIVIIKLIVMLAAVLAMFFPLFLEMLSFKQDKNRRISYKRLRIIIYTAVYIVVVTIALFCLKEFIIWLESLSFVQWLANNISVNGRTQYFGKLVVVMMVNFAILLVYRLFGSVVKIGLKKKSLTEPKQNSEGLDRKQLFELKVIRYFHTETWFLVARILKYLSIALTLFYALMFLIYQIPAVFGAAWIPYDLVSTIFSAGYIYPAITLLGLWEAYFFLAGIKRIESECPELLDDGALNMKKITASIQEIDSELKKQFKDYYVCDVDLTKTVIGENPTTNHRPVTENIARAIENDRRNPQRRKEIYLNCVDKLDATQSSLLVNGDFFSEFSMYFFRYLSVIIARGDNVVFVCNNDEQIESVYDYVTQGFSEISSLYCKEFEKDSVNFDNPIWKAVKVSGENNDVAEAYVQQSNILVTSLGYLCSKRFEDQHKNFVSLIDMVVFVDSLKTVNTFNRQLAILNTRLKHLTKKNSLAAKNGRADDMFRARYMSRQVRYICFDASRTPGLDKVLKNMLAVDFETVDSMNYNPKTVVRCYNYDGKVNENGRIACPQFFSSEEEVGVIMNMSILCLMKGASYVSLFADDILPYKNIVETLSSNMGRLSVKADESSIRINKRFYNPNGYSVVIAIDSEKNLPATIRKYVSMVSDKPTLVIVFSRPYMLRDYYQKNIDDMWCCSQLERIPVEEGSKRDIAQRILVKANSGGISKAEVIRLAANIPQYSDYVDNNDVDSILRSVLEIYGMSKEERLDLFKYFEYTSLRDFDENGKYNSEVKIILRRSGDLFERINGRDMVKMLTGDREITLPVPRSRLTQNYIAGQNLIYNGNIYHINKIDTILGQVYARLAVGGKNNETYQYAQSREYRLELDKEKTENIFPTKHVVLRRSSEKINVNDAYVSVFRAPMDVLTKGYYEIDPHTLATNTVTSEYHSISDSGNDELAKQTYRRYGSISEPAYSSEIIMKSVDWTSNNMGALVMSIRLCGAFGSDINRTMLLASTVLNEVLHSMFPSVADSIVVCPILNGSVSDEESSVILEKLPHVSLVGNSDLVSTDDFNLLIIEDCSTDLGVVSVLMSSGDDIFNTLFEPIANYLKWYSEEGHDYLYFGLDHEPSCFDFESLRTLSLLLGDDKHDKDLVDVESLIEYDVCDFCGKRYVRGDDVLELDDGRKMCKVCSESIVGNDRKTLKSHLDRAKIYLESTYGIVFDEDYDFCFESTVKIVNMIKQSPNMNRRGGDVPLMSYVDDENRAHVEYSIPSVNLSELLVRELTHLWQIKHLPDLDDELAEGHIALVSLQYLRFLNQDSLATVRTTYYESTRNTSGQGYRRLIRELLENPQYNNNPFRYLLERSGEVVEEEIIPPTPKFIEDGDYGLKYTPEVSDRATDGKLKFFYYERLDSKRKKAYDVILEAIKKHEETVNVVGCSFDDVDKVTDAIAYDHPELFWYRTFSVSGSKVILFYGASAEESEMLQKRIDEVVVKYLEGIDDSMSAYDVAVRMHVKIISSVDYDTIALNKQEQEGGPPVDKIDYLRSICGVFLNGKAVCEGYARALQYLLQRCGVECAEAVGYIRKETGESDGAHAWNIIKIDGDYYYIDTTWDDSSNTVQRVKKTDLGFDYFCITTDELLRTRDLELCPVAMPSCDAVRGNYYYHNDMVLDAYDLNKIKTIAENAANRKSKFFTFKCKTKSMYETALNQLCAVGEDCFEALNAASRVDKQILPNTYLYTHDKNIWTITVKFRYKQ